MRWFMRPGMDGFGFIRQRNEIFVFELLSFGLCEAALGESY